MYVMEKKELFYFLVSVPAVFVSVLIYGMVLMKNGHEKRKNRRFHLHVFIFCINMLYLLLFDVFAVCCLYYVFYPWKQLGGFLLMVVFFTGLALSFGGWVIKNMLPGQWADEKQAETAFPADVASADGIEERIEKRLMDLFEQQCIYRRPGLTITEVARLAGTNRTYISMVIHQKFNIHFGGFVNRYRIREATELMQSTRQTVKEISEIVGFNSISAFNSSFREIYGQSPSTWKKEQGIC